MYLNEFRKHLPVKDRKSKFAVKWIIKRMRKISGINAFVHCGLRHKASSIMVYKTLGRGAGLSNGVKILGHTKLKYF
jgi:hypothetical protein